MLLSEELAELARHVHVDLEHDHVPVPRSGHGTFIAGYIVKAASR
jgi:hypothetical protein